MENIMRIQKDGAAYNFIRGDGTFLTEAWWLYATPFYQGLARVQGLDGSWGFLKPDGTLLSA